MAKYLIEVEVDEKALRIECGDEESSIEYLIESEMGWVRGSGIYVENVTIKIEDDDKDV